jgi:hypothetical protein
MKKPIVGDVSIPYLPSFRPQHGFSIPIPFSDILKLEDPRNPRYHTETQTQCRMSTSQTVARHRREKQSLNLCFMNTKRTEFVIGALSGILPSKGGSTCASMYTP